MGEGPGAGANGHPRPQQSRTTTTNRLLQTGVAGSSLGGGGGEEPSQPSSWPLGPAGSSLVEGGLASTLVLASPLHVFKELQSLVWLLALLACADQSAVCDDVRLRPLLLHLIIILFISFFR